MSCLIVKRIVGGDTNIVNRDIECVCQNKTINLHNYDEFICANITNATVMAIRQLPCIIHHAAVLSLVEAGTDVWSSTLPILCSMRTHYINHFATVPINTQFVEREVKESGCVTIGRRRETSRSILEIACGKVLSEVMTMGR